MPGPTHCLYHDYSIDFPIHDYYCLLEPGRNRNNRPFEILYTT
ncbi:MAG: hypothetical protein HON77_02655 [Gammaproteobacteria bacterium]|nr:hypothetical protein [Gammaproteobacteria bacterium]MBT5153721.1 hypothetical protein [Gammaproteobacteria bacterium]MBT5686870.1 hypothetical protein [Gammaproteobacteria bacterium]MBT5724735.1 hypothetical protein [Gammaproteobacteria bacterium]MBT6583182.1 hypothetical protein [Gammaproteobacteria bacterium]